MVDERYYSQRQARARKLPSSNIGADFWVAFLTYLKRLSSQNYLSKEFPSHCDDGHPVGSNDNAIEKRLREEFGNIGWPISQLSPPATDRILDLLEFFYRHVAKPTKEWFHSHCNSSHPEEYDVAKGRYEFTVQVNAMLHRFNHPYRLKKGRVERSGSEILDARIGSIEFRTEDTHLLNLIASALDSYFDKSGKRKLEGLQSLVDAYERLKTLEAGDKRQSVAQVISKLSQEQEIRAHFDAHLRKMTELANKYTIRHHETDKLVLEDEALIDYLFYSYYNLVRLVLEKYGCVE